MPHVDKKAAITFCQLCDWTYQAWITHKCLFDANPTPHNNMGRSPYFARRLAAITQEYALQQIAKLHDPWKRGNATNLTIDYIVERGAWGTQKPVVQEIAAKLAKLHQLILPARNKILSHHDLDTATSNTTLGSFSAGDDDSYFASLQELVDAVHDRWVGGPYPFDDLAEADAREFLQLLERAPHSRHRTG